MALEIPMQIIAVDDCSDDDTIAKVKAWSDTCGQSVEIIRNPHRLYSYASRLSGMGKAIAPIVWNIDADDVIPPNANINDALDQMERLAPDILHCKAVGVDRFGSLQKPLLWSEPVAEKLDGSHIFNTFMAMDYPPAILWNKFFSLNLCRKICSQAPDLEVRYFDVKFLGIMALLFANTYYGSNNLVYEYKMRQIRPAWLYARQVNSLLLLKSALSPIIGGWNAKGLAAFSRYCHDRLVIQTGHLSIMGAHELEGKEESLCCEWLETEILANISLRELLDALTVSIQANALRIRKFVKILSGIELEARDTDLFSILQSRKPLCLTDMEALQVASHLPREVPASYRNALILIFANATLARSITRVMTPDVDIRKKAN